MSTVNQRLEDILLFPVRNPRDLAQLTATEAGELLERLKMQPQVVELMLTHGHPLAEARLILLARREGRQPEMEAIASAARGEHNDQPLSLPLSRAEPDRKYRSSFAAGVATLTPDSSSLGTASSQSASPEISDRMREASAKLEQLKQNPEWTKRAVERGTPEAEERIMLTRAANGASISDAELAAQANGRLDQYRADVTAGERFYPQGLRYGNDFG
jgi:hypothetical protein